MCDVAMYNATALWQWHKDAIGWLWKSESSIHVDVYIDSMHGTHFLLVMETNKHQ